MNRRASLLLLFVVLVASLSASGCWSKKKKGPPPPPQRVTVRADTTLRVSGNGKAAGVADLTKGTTVAVLKLNKEWVAVTTTDGKAGFIERSSFARRTLLVGTGGFPYTRTVGDRLRRVPMLDIIRIEDTGRVMPSTPAGGLAGAQQLDGGVRAEIVIGVTAAGRQFLYEVVDLKNKKVLLREETDNAIYVGDAATQMAAAIAFVIEKSEVPVKVDADGMPIAEPTPPPTPIPSRTPEPPHPNAPLLTPTPSASPLP